MSVGAGVAFSLQKHVLAEVTNVAHGCRCLWEKQAARRAQREDKTGYHRNTQEAEKATADEEDIVQTYLDNSSLLPS